MRLGIDGHILDGKYQGSRTWLEALLGRIAALRPQDVFVLYTHEPERHRQRYTAPNIEHRRLPRRGGAPARLLLLWPWLAYRHRLDGLMTQYNAPLFGAGLQIVVIHDILFETHRQFFPAAMGARLRLLTRLSAWRARLVLTVSDFSRASIERVYGLADGRIAVVANGIEPGPAGALPAEVGKGLPFALFVGRLEPRKNLSLLLEALTLLPDPEIRVVVVGREDHSDDRIVTAMRADPRVIHLRDVPDDSLRALYRQARVFVYPSLGEGFGIPVLEALAQGCPVIASTATAIPEVGGDAVNFFEPAAVDAAPTLAGLLDDAFHGRLALDPQAAARQLERYTWDRAAESLAAALEKVSRDVAVR